MATGVSANTYLYYQNLANGKNPDGSKATAGNIAWGKAQMNNSYVIAAQPVITPPIVVKAATPVTVVQKAIEAVKNAVTGGGGTIVPPTKAVGGESTFTIQPYVPKTTVTVTLPKFEGSTIQQTSVSASTAATVSELDKRKAYAANFTGWDNDPTLRAYQQKSMDIYINTGRWDSPEQIQLHAQAEALRKSINPTYQGAIYGTPDKAAADALILPDNQPNVTLVSDSVTGGIKNAVTGLVGADMGGMMKIGLFGLGAFMVISLFKGGR